MSDLAVNGELKEKIINGLVEENLITRDALEEIMAVSQESGRTVEDLIIERGYLTREKLASFIEKYLELPRVDLTSYVPDPDALKLVPKSIVHKYLILPLFEIEGVLTVAISDPLAVFHLDALSEELNIGLDPVLATEGSLIDAVIIYYGVTPDEIPAAGREEVSETTLEIEDEDLFYVDLDRLAIIEGEGVSGLLTEILIKAKKAGATSIHIEPITGDFRVLFRMKDGLKVVGEAARSLQKPLAEQIKNHSRMPRNITRPLEKVVEFPRAGEMVVSVYPTVHGERYVLTFVKARKEITDLSDYGFSSKDIDSLNSIFKEKRGLILIGSPLNSGKTSLVRTILSLTSGPDKSSFYLATSEVKAVNGVQFQRLKGEQLVDAIEGLARQDVDIVGIDEIDSPEAATAVVKLSENSLTIATFEASNVVDAISRMLEAGVEPFSLSWTLKAVVSTRLLARNCLACREEYRSPLSGNRVVKKFIPEDAPLYRSKGCEKCENTGTQGYLVVSECLVLTDAMQKKIAAGFNRESFTNYIRSKGVVSILACAMEQVKKGEVTLEEVYRKTAFKE